MTDCSPPDDNSRRARQMRALNQTLRNEAIAASPNVTDIRCRLMSRKAMIISEEDCA